MRRRRSGGRPDRVGPAEPGSPLTTGSVRELLADGRAGSVRAVARLLSLVETGGDPARQIAAAVAGHQPRAVVLGLTGPPGVGKSTLTTRLVADARQVGRRVAVLAVDPSSPFSGGALLGDRVRMGDHATDPGVFIRSMSSRGRLGGLSAATPAAVELMSALGHDLVLVETVGVGQNEVDVMALADTVLLVLAPGMGDGIQAAKAGILEIADILVVNKADREGSAATRRELMAMLTLGRAGRAEPGSWRVPVLTAIAVTGQGVPELTAALQAHHDHLRTSGESDVRAARRSAAAVTTIVTAHFLTELDRRPPGDTGGRSTPGQDPYTVAHRWWSELGPLAPEQE